VVGGLAARALGSLARRVLPRSPMPNLRERAILDLPAVIRGSLLPGHPIGLLADPLLEAMFHLYAVKRFLPPVRGPRRAAGASRSSIGRSPRGHPPQFRKRRRCDSGLQAVISLLARHAQCLFPDSLLNAQGHRHAVKGLLGLHRAPPESLDAVDAVDAVPTPRRDRYARRCGARDAVPCHSTEPPAPSRPLCGIAMDRRSAARRLIPTPSATRRLRARPPSRRRPWRRPRATCRRPGG